MLVEILPPVRATDVTGTRATERFGLALVDGGEREPERPLLRPEHTTAVMNCARRNVVVSAAAQMRREQHVWAQRLVAVEHDFDQQHVALRIGREP